MGWLVLSKYLRLPHCIPKHSPLFCYAIWLKALRRDDFKLTLAVNCVSWEVNEASLRGLCRSVCAVTPLVPQHSLQDLDEVFDGNWSQHAILCFDLSCRGILHIVNCTSVNVPLNLKLDSSSQYHHPQSHAYEVRIFISCQKWSSEKRDLQDLPYI